MDYLGGVTLGKMIFVGNYKGGVGKTTSVYQIALHMLEMGKRVLLIDLDPQCSLSEICMYRNNESLNELESTECLNYVFDSWIQAKNFSNIQFAVDKKMLVRQTIDGIHFIPSNIFYKNGGLDELSIKLKDEFEDLFVLQQVFQNTKLANDYDYILFDCPPSNNLITQGAFLLSDYYIIPTIIQKMSVRGVVHYINTIEKTFTNICVKHEKERVARILFGPKPQLIGILETLKIERINNKEERKDLISELEKANKVSLVCFKGNKFIFTNTISNLKDISTETAIGNKIEHYAPITKEILNCLESDFSPINV